MYSVYILYSTKCDKFYVGFSADINARLQRHNSGTVAATENCTPYQLKASKRFPTQKEARLEELRIKKQKSRKYKKGLFYNSPEPNT